MFQSKENEQREQHTHYPNSVITSFAAWRYKENTMSDEKDCIYLYYI